MTAPMMPERQFRTAVIGAAARTGWLIHSDIVSAQMVPVIGPDGARRFRRVRANARAGFPDLCMIHPDRRVLVFAELKRDAPAHTVAAGAHGRDLSAPQTEWLTALMSWAAAAGIASASPYGRAFVRVWRPAQLAAIYAFLADAAAPCP